jgi:hypothetical protein
LHENSFLHEIKNTNTIDKRKAESLVWVLIRRIPGS